MESKESIRISLGDWLFNSGVTGLVNILGEENIKFIDKQTMEIPVVLLENFEEKYFDYFINTYKKILSWNKIVSYKEKIIFHREANFENFTEASFEELNKFIGSGSTSGTLKYYLKSASYNSVYHLLDANIDILELEKGITPIKKLSKSETLKDKLDDVKSVFEKIETVISIFESEKGRKYLASKNIIYTIIKNSWNGVCFLNPQTKEKDVYVDYKNYFLSPVAEYKKLDKAKYKYNCFICDEPVKDLNNDLSFLNETGFDTNRKTSHVWNFNNDVGVCPVCKLVYSCVPAGMSFVYDKGIYINDNSSIENAVLINNKIKSEILKEREVGASLTYKALIESINEEFHEKMKYELADIQVVRYENETYRFNILTKKMLEVIKKSKSDLNVLNKMGYKEINTYFNIYELVIQRILNNHNLYTLIHKLLLYKISSIKDLYYPIDSMMNLLRINIKFLEGIGAMEKNNDDIIRIANGSGYYLKKKYREKGTEDKLRGISYRLLNALKTNNTGMFMDTLLNCYLYIQDAVPKIFLEVLKDEDEFKNVGYAFLTGLIDGKVDTGNDNKNNEGGNE